MEIMVEIYLGEEQNKSGIALHDAEELISYAMTKKNLRLIGIMMMAPNIPPEERRAYFRAAKEFFDAMKKKYPSLTHLSMGMTDDFGIALQEGSTMVRIGTGIFGMRE